MLSIPCVYLLFVHFLWKKVYANPLPLSVLSYFSFYSVLKILYIFQILVTYQIHDLQVFLSIFFGCLFTFLKVLFASQKFNFYMVPFIYLFFFACTFALYLRTHCITQSDSSKSLMVLALTSMICVCAQSLSCVWLFAAPQTVACQAPLPMGFSRQECWGEVPFPTPGDLTNSGSNPCLLHLLHWQADSLPLMTTGKPHPWSILS